MRATLHRVVLRGFRRLPRRVRRLIVRFGTPNYTVGAICLVEDDDGRLLLVRQAYRGRGVRRVGCSSGARARWRACAVRCGKRSGSTWRSRESRLWWWLQNRNGLTSSSVPHPWTVRWSHTHGHPRSSRRRGSRARRATGGAARALGSRWTRWASPSARTSRSSAPKPSEPAGPASVRTPTSVRRPGRHPARAGPSLGSRFAGPGRVAQLARALPLQGRCRGFESLRPTTVRAGQQGCEIVDHVAGGIGSARNPRKTCGISGTLLEASTSERSDRHGRARQAGPIGCSRPVSRCA